MTFQMAMAMTNMRELCVLHRSYIHSMQKTTADLTNNTALTVGITIY
jgi:hypothetical protein